MNFRLLRACFVTIGMLAMAGCTTLHDKYLSQINKVSKDTPVVTQENQVRDAARQLDAEKIGNLTATGSDAAKVAGACAIAMQNIVADMAKATCSKGSSGK